MWCFIQNSIEVLSFDFISLPSFYFKFLYLSYIPASQYKQGALPNFAVISAGIAPIVQFMLALSNSLPQATYIKYKFYLEMLMLLLVHNLFQLFLANSIIFPQQLTQLFSPPMIEWASVMLPLFWSCTGDNIPALPSIFCFSFTLKPIGMLYIIQMSFHLRSCHFTLEMLSEIFLIVMNIHATGFEKTP